MQRLGYRHEPVLGDLLRLQRHGAESVIADLAAVEKESDTSWTAIAWRPEVNAGQPGAHSLKAALLANLSLARLPRRLTVGLHDPARNGPP